MTSAAQAQLLDLLERYRTLLRSHARDLLGRDPKNILAALLQADRVRAYDLGGGNTKYYRLSPDEAKRRGLPESMGRPSANLAIDLGILCACHQKKYKRLAPDELVHIHPNLPIAPKPQEESCFIAAHDPRGPGRFLFIRLYVATTPRSVDSRVRRMRRDFSEMLRHGRLERISKKRLIGVTMALQFPSPPRDGLQEIRRKIRKALAPTKLAIDALFVPTLEELARGLGRKAIAKR